MEILNDLFNGLITYLGMMIDFISPYSVEIIATLIMATFVLGFMQTHR